MSIFKKKALFSILVLIIGIAIFSNQAIAQEQGEAELVGHVVDATSQEAIAKAQVTLQGEGEEATTGKDGSFSFESLTPGTYTLIVTAEGYQDWEKEVEVIEQGEAIQIQLKPLSDL